MEITGSICNNDMTTTTKLLEMRLLLPSYFCEDNNITSSVSKQRFYGKIEEKSGKKFIAMT